MNKYNIEQFVKKINAPILCRFDGKELSFGNGIEMAAFQFDKRYQVDGVSIEDEKAVITLSEMPIPNINSVGEELMLGENWIEKHKEKYGVEPNLFDGV